MYVFCQEWWSDGFDFPGGGRALYRNSHFLKTYTAPESASFLYSLFLKSA